jgi:predicted secreted hydrolase
MEFDLERLKEKGEWVYNFSNKIDDNEVDLTFIGTTKGWKFITDAECWAVPLPKAQVKGEISVHGEKMSVEGYGYHDHNWNSTLSSVLNIWGWYWGKVASNTLNLVWVYVMKTPKEGKLGVVINQDGQGFFYIDPNKIHFKTDKFIRSHGRKIPTKFSLQFDDIVNNIPIKGDIKTEIINSHFKSALIAPYWRHHIKATGFLTIGTYKEEVNSTHIMESFRLF